MSLMLICIMKIHYLQHVPFEGPASILSWAKRKGHSVSSTKLFAHESMPAYDSLDFLIIMGGPMNIYDYRQYPWLKAEYSFIENSISHNKKVLGICLGAQLIAHVLGAKIYPNAHSEIGWLPVQRTAKYQENELITFPSEFTAFHWHGDTFDLPPGSIHLVRSQACENQAFLYNNSILGLQFHLESTRKSIDLLIKNSMKEISEGPYIQKAEEIKRLNDKHLAGSNLLLEDILGSLTA